MDWRVQMLDSSLRSTILDGHRKIETWLSTVEEATSPHFTEVHSLLGKAAKSAQLKRDSVTTQPIKSQL